MNSKRTLLLSCLILLSVSLLDCDDLEDLNRLSFDQLTYMTEEFPPFNYTEGNELKGISVELLWCVWDNLGIQKKTIDVLPWARAYYNLQNLENQVLFTTSRTEERENQFKWVGSIYTAKLVLISLSKSPISLNSLDEAKVYEIGTVRDDASEQLLISNGFSSLDLQRVNTLDQNIKKLQLGRIDFLSYAEESFVEYLNKNGLNREDFKVAYVIKQTESYYAFSKDVPDFVVNRFQKALDELDHQRLQIINKYFN